MNRKKEKGSQKASKCFCLADLSPCPAAPERLNFSVICGSYDFFRTLKASSFK